MSANRSALLFLNMKPSATPMPAPANNNAYQREKSFFLKKQSNSDFQKERPENASCPSLKHHAMRTARKIPIRTDSTKFPRKRSNKWPCPPTNNSPSTAYTPYRKSMNESASTPPTIMQKLIVAIRGSLKPAAE